MLISPVGTGVPTGEGLALRNDVGHARLARRVSPPLTGCTASAGLTVGRAAVAVRHATPYRGLRELAVPGVPRSTNQAGIAENTAAGSLSFASLSPQSRDGATE